MSPEAPSADACVCVAAGGPGLHDPCEKEPTNTLAEMTDQQAEAITYSAQVFTGHMTLLWSARRFPLKAAFVGLLHGTINKNCCN